MVSVYGYVSLANLENFTGIDYSAVDAVAYTDARVEANITLAERMVNAYLGVSTGQTKSDGIVTATTLISQRILHDNMVELGYATEEPVKFNVYIDSIMAMWLKGDAETQITSIPMSGASYHKPDFRFL